MKTFLAGAMIALVFSATVHAQAAITGKWQGKTPNGFELELDLTATKTALTGTLTRSGQATEISDGKVSQNTFTFQATLNDQKAGFTGEIDGDQIKLWMDRQGPSAAVVIKRVVDVKRDADARLTGRWQGTTASGRPLALELKVDGQVLTGRLTLAQQSTDITEGKVEGDTFSLTAGPLDGRTVVCNGRLASEEVELTVQGVGSPLTLKRAK